VIGVLVTIGLMNGTLTHIKQFLHSCFELFFSRKFELHRLGGLAFASQYVAAIVWYFMDKESFLDSWLVLTLPLTGLMQSITASIYFTFLPKKVDPAYFADKYSLSYSFVVENIFFAGILCFQWWYYCDYIIDYMPSLVLYAFIFFPYVWRPIFPKTSFRESLYNKANKTSQYFEFFTNSTYFVKIFYIFSKHFIGYFLNYIRFLNRPTKDQRISVYLMLIVASFSTTIAMFLHTLAFKGYITKKRSMEFYLASLLVLAYAWLSLFEMIYNNLDLALLVLIGAGLNFKNRYYQHSWQVFVFVVLYSAKYQYPYTFISP
jgi:hypothetical protein